MCAMSISNVIALNVDIMICPHYALQDNLRTKVYFEMMHLTTIFPLVTYLLNRNEKQKFGKFSNKVRKENLIKTN